MAAAREEIRVLLVEDEPLVLVLMEELLIEFGCRVVGPASDVAAALRLVASEAIDAALLDVGLGRAERGFPVAAALADRRVPFAFVSGYGPESLPPEFRARPMLRKPFHPAQLRSMVTSLAGAG